MSADLDPRTQQAATVLLAVGHAAVQDGDWSTSVDVANRLVVMLSGTSAASAAHTYRDILVSIQHRRAEPAPVSDTDANTHADELLTAWMHLRGALLP
ncbi:hypothetical protein [Knoellia sp. LjRoot47]|uniref:hypothetical protein n=1 Tax=Knoellia sp. LjRoot47 TaxID=3342330 RepID=UPI003ECEF4EF